MKSSLLSFTVLLASFSWMPAIALSGATLHEDASANNSALEPESESGSVATPAVVETGSISIPGPLRSFLRMAGISQKASREEVLPLLSRNIYIQGYRSTQPTEFLLLLQRYVSQARELEILAGANHTIRVANCDDAGTLVQILGYRLRQGCGQKDFLLETSNPERAFITIDSGFPLTELEEALQNGVPFTYAYQASRVPVMFHETDWIQLSATAKRTYGNLLDLFLNEPSVARLYWGLGKIDAETRDALLQSPGLLRLLPYAATLDFYGSQVRVRSGHVKVPGEPASEPAWKDLAGVNPASAGDFVTHLLAKDGGLLAAYYDVLSRISPSQQQRLTQPARLNRFYDAFRTPYLEFNANKGVFRKAPELLVLFTRIEWEPDGQPHVPGGVDVWKEILSQKSDAKVVHAWNKRTRSWTGPEDVLEAMIAFSRMESDCGPLQMYLLFSEIDHRRSPTRYLSPQTVRLMANSFSKYNMWYLVFSEFPNLSDASISSFVSVADSIDKISNQNLHGNALGDFQATIGIWQILARQGEIPDANLDESWQKMVAPFAQVGSSPQLFDAARKSLGETLLAAGLKPNSTQDQIVDLLAGPPQLTPEGQRVHLDLAEKIRSVLEDQRLVSIDTLFGLSDGFDEMAKGSRANARMLPLAGELREFEMPRPIFTNSEKVNWAPAVYNSHHAELQVRTDLTKVIQSPASRAQLETARGQLTPFLRDTLVGLNYAYYEPPGAQLLHNNPLFVRSHDFSGISMTGPDRLWQAPELLGAGASAGGGAFLTGSLAELFYSLAVAEQDFIAPENVQALIWKEVVPDLMVSATLPRWWNVTPNELHAVTLYQRSGEELFLASTANPELRSKVTDILSSRMAPLRLERVKQALNRKEDADVMLSALLPAETFYLSAEFRRTYPDQLASWGAASKELDGITHRLPEEVSCDRLSKDFGVPHPTLARTYAREVLNVKPFPFFGSYSSRLFAESWESNNLYWARLADEMGYSPVMLNSLVPELTHQMTAKIFATDLEDWPAILRAMHETGEEFRQGKIQSLPLKSAIPSSLVRTTQDANAK